MPLLRLEGVYFVGDQAVQSQAKQLLRKSCVVDGVTQAAQSDSVHLGHGGRAPQRVVAHHGAALQLLRCIEPTVPQRIEQQAPRQCRFGCLRSRTFPPSEPTTCIHPASSPVPTVNSSASQSAPKSIVAASSVNWR